MVELQPLNYDIYGIENKKISKLESHRLKKHNLHLKEMFKEMAKLKPLNYDIYGPYRKQLDAKTINFAINNLFSTKLDLRDHTELTT